MMEVVPDTPDTWPIGLTVVQVRPMTPPEMEAEGWQGDWNGCPAVLVMSDGSLIYPSSDPEGNAAGAVFAMRPAPDGEYTEAMLHFAIQ